MSGFGFRNASLRILGGFRPLVTAASCALLFLLPGAASVGAQERIRIAPSSPGLASWPIRLAVREGMFSREGLSVEIIVMRTNTGSRLWSPAASISPPRAAPPCAQRSTVRRSR